MASIIFFKKKTARGFTHKCLFDSVAFIIFLINIFYTVVNLLTRFFKSTITNFIDDGNLAAMVKSLCIEKIL
ncbi:hypothetical protein L3BBH23_26690 [Longicatena caecimuris]|nr:hypothetical protein L3BBH23_26690 [Longicatena caecimuris]